MVPGLSSFKKAFSGFENQYTIIGGTACDVLMENRDMDFRATKDLDIVLIVEMLTPEFVDKFWDFIKEAGYTHRNKSTGNVEFYRFYEPKNRNFPKMIELFTRKPDVIKLPEDAVLTPLPLSDELSSLSAILLNDDYYKFLLSGSVVIDGVSILSASHLIPFKAKAWLDLSDRKLQGFSVDSKDIRKHKNDVFRLSIFLNNEQKVYVPSEIYFDMLKFIDKMQSEDIDLKVLGLGSVKKDNLLNLMKSVYQNDMDLFKLREKILKEIAKGKSFSRIEKAIKTSSNFDRNTLALLNQIKNQADIKAIIDKEQEHSR